MSENIEIWPNQLMADEDPSVFEAKKIKITLTSLIVAIISGFFLLFLLTPNSVAKNFDKITADELIFLTNQKRADYNLPALSANSKLTLAAENKVNDIFEEQFFSHNSPSGKRFSDWVKEAEYSYLVVGENLAMGFGDSRQIIEAWMQSPDHKKNILMRRYQDIGMAVAKGRLDGKDVTLVVQYFGADKAKKISELLVPYQKLSEKNTDLMTAS